MPIIDSAVIFINKSNIFLPVSQSNKISNMDLFLFFQKCNNDIYSYAQIDCTFYPDFCYYFFQLKSCVKALLNYFAPYL